MEQLAARRAHNPEVAGSSPAAATIKVPGMDHSGYFLLLFRGYKFWLSNTFLTHALRNWGQLLQSRQIFRQGGGHPLVRCRRRVDVGVGGKIVVAVPQPGLNVLQRVAQVQHDRGAAVPLRYNYDKPEKPRRIKGFEVFSLIFSSFSKPKNHTEISRIAGGVSLTTNE